KALPDAPEDRAELVREAAKTLGATILLKGHVDIVTDGKRDKFNYTGNPGMTVGGTGDVLCGVVAGLMSKGMPPFDAARLGAFTNGYAGDLAFKLRGCGLPPVDVPDSLGRGLPEFLGTRRATRAGPRHNHYADPPLERTWISSRSRMSPHSWRTTSSSSRTCTSESRRSCTKRGFGSRAGRR